MAYTTNQLITESFYAAGVVSRQFATVSGQQVLDGLRWLNNIIDEKAIDIGMIPYETVYQFDSEVNVEEYFIPNLQKINTLVFYIENVRYSMTFEKRNQYFGASRVDNIQALPFNWYFENCFGGGKLYIYFKPDQAYPMTIHGVFRLENVSLGQDLAANVSQANLGTPTVIGTGQLTTGQLVMNNVDLSGYMTSSLTAVVGATTSNLNATYANGALGVGATLTNAGTMAAFSVDDIVFVGGERVLVKNQEAPEQNGIYTITTLGSGATNWVLTRATDFDTAAEMVRWSFCNVTNGTVNAGRYYISTDAVTTVGTDAVVFQRNAQALAAYINTGLVTGITASVVGTELVISSSYKPIPVIIKLETTGLAETNNVTFPNFVTNNGEHFMVYNPIGLEGYYRTYLHYALTNKICTEYNYTVPVNIVKELSKYEGLIKKKSRVMDLRLQKSSMLQKNGSLSWAQINIGKGFEPTRN